MDSKLAAMLPRFMRRWSFLQDVLKADQMYASRRTTGPLVIEAHYAEGEPKSVKLKTEQGEKLI